MIFSCYNKNKCIAPWRHAYREKNGVIVKIKRKSFVNLALSLITLISGQIIFGTQVFAVTDPTLTINLGSLSSLDLMPGNFGSVSQSVGITTNNYTGYTVNLTNPTNSTDLINTNDNTLTIPTITLPSGTTSITENDFGSGYGISIDGTNYLPAPTSASEIPIGSSNIAGTNSYTLTFGAKPASDTTKQAFILRPLSLLL